MLLAAQKGGYAVGAFNVENMEMAQAVIAAAEELQAPVMIQTTPSTVRYGSLALYRANVAALAKAAKVPVAMHLDHGNSFELAAQALREGYTSIMIDGSHEIFEENIALTQKVVAMCKPNQIPVEAELGKVGGKEDDLNGRCRRVYRSFRGERVCKADAGFFPGGSDWYRSWRLCRRAQAGCGAFEGNPESGRNSFGVARRFRPDG